jgi:hypothetical protein
LKVMEEYAGRLGNGRAVERIWNTSQS